MASHDKKILRPWIGKSWEAIRGATTPGGVISPGDVDELGVAVKEIPPEVEELKKVAEGPSGPSGGITEKPSELPKSPVPASERAEDRTLRTAPTTPAPISPIPPSITRGPQAELRGKEAMGETLTQTDFEKKYGGGWMYAAPHVPPGMEMTEPAFFGTGEKSTLTDEENLALIKARRMESAVPRPFEFSTDYKNLYGNVKEWLQNPIRYKKELAVAVPLLDKMAQHEINAYRESGATGSLGISPADSAKIAKETSAIPSDIAHKKAQTEALIRESSEQTKKQKLLIDVSMEEETDAVGTKIRRFNPDTYNQLAPSFGLPTLPKSEGGQTKKPTLDEFIKEARNRKSKLTDDQLKAYYKKEYGGI